MQRIPSIHKYCNRWCARCPFQERCAFYLAQQDTEGEIDWSEGLETLSEVAPHPFQAIDLKKVEALEQHMAAREKAGPFDLDKAPLILFYQKWKSHYYDLMKHLKANSMVQSLASRAFLSTSDDLKLDNACKVLEHYQEFLGPKLMRALGGKHDEINSPSSTQSDWNGSAKAAGLALKHLRLALEDLYELDLNLEFDLSDFLGETNRFLKTHHFEFPEWEAFVRPGFDQLSSQRLSGDFSH